MSRYIDLVEALNNIDEIKFPNARNNLVLKANQSAVEDWLKNLLCGELLADRSEYFYDAE